jgi:hypothetical protein
VTAAAPNHRRAATRRAAFPGHQGAGSSALGAWVVASWSTKPLSGGAGSPGETGTTTPEVTKIRAEVTAENMAKNV